VRHGGFPPVEGRENDNVLVFKLSRFILEKRAAFFMLLAISLLAFPPVGSRRKLLEL
jgi:hypothetical protein